MLKNKKIENNENKNNHNQRRVILKEKKNDFSCSAGNDIIIWNNEKKRKILEITREDNEINKLAKEILIQKGYIKATLDSDKFDKTRLEKLNKVIYQLQNQSRDENPNCNNFLDDNNYNYQNDQNNEFEMQNEKEIKKNLNHEEIISIDIDMENQVKSKQNDKFNKFKSNFKTQRQVVFDAENNEMVTKEPNEQHSPTKREN